MLDDSVKYVGVAYFGTLEGALSFSNAHVAGLL